eukprot:214932-Amphidinium_carterae.1
MKPISLGRCFSVSGMPSKGEAGQRKRLKTIDPSVEHDSPKKVQNYAFKCTGTSTSLWQFASRLPSLQVVTFL